MAKGMFAGFKRFATLGYSTFFGHRGTVLIVDGWRDSRIAYRGPMRGHKSEARTDINVFLEFVGMDPIPDDEDIEEKT